MVRVLLSRQDGVGEMTEGQCWSIQGDGSRCAQPEQPGSYFCSGNRYVSRNEVPRIWRAPEAAMPCELVAALRRADPKLNFPVSAPELSTEGIVSAPHS